MFYICRIDRTVMIVYDEAVSVVDAQCCVTQFDSSIHTLRQTPRLDGMPIDQIHFDARVSRVPSHTDFFFFFFQYCAGQRFIAALSHTEGQARKN